MKKLECEKLTLTTDRLKVSGGWIVRTCRDAEIDRLRKLVAEMDG